MPEAQGPRLTRDGEVDAQGPFRYIRHPDNLPIIIVLWSFRRMTVNRLVLAVVSSGYAVLGSWHEDRRLLATYGKVFHIYRRRVPMMIPELWHRSQDDPLRSEARERAESVGEALPEIYDEWIQGDGVTLHVVRAGKGPPVILLHGFPENWCSWRYQIPALVRAGFSVWALDLRGYNLSSRPSCRDAYHLQHLVRDVAAVVHATGQQGAHIIGHDWGGVIAWTFAGVYPELTRRLIILNAPHMRIYLRRVRRLAQMLRSWYVLFFQVRWLAERALSANQFLAVRFMFKQMTLRRGTFSQADIEHYTEALSEPGALTAALNYYRANLGPDALSLASSAMIAAKTLVIWGEKDPALSIGLLEGLEEVAPLLTVQRIPHAGHWVHREAPAEVNRLALAFLRDSEFSRTL
jgi:pimeloyl-ACP methyl ester carboxylesterase